MATVLCDLDGTLVRFGTNEFLPNAIEALSKFYHEGNQVVFTTSRQKWYPISAELAKTLYELFPGCQIFWGLSSPRILINDQGAACINHQTDDSWAYDLSAMAGQ